MAGLQIVVFYLNNDLYGVDSSCVNQIIKYQNVTEATDMPDFVEGVINYRGAEVPVINLNKKLGYPKTETTNKTKIIIADISSRSIGFIVDNITELARFDESEMEVLPEVLQKAGNAYIKRVTKRNDQIFSILELDLVLNGFNI